MDFSITNPKIGNNGKFEGSFAICVNITERKKAENALMESEKHFCSVFDNSLDAIYRVNLKTNCYEYMSPAFEDIFGFSTGDIISRTPKQAMSLIHPDDIPLVKENLAILADKGKVKVEYSP